MDNIANSLYEERKQRIVNAVGLKKTDRIPLFLPFGMFAARYAGISFREAIEDTDKWFNAMEKTHMDLEPDMCSIYLFDQASNKTLKSKVCHWPGYGSNLPLQFIEREYMKAEEYDEFLSDSSDFIIRKFLPRTYGALEDFSTLPPVSRVLFSYTNLGVLFNKDTIQSLKDMVKAAEQYVEFNAKAEAFISRLQALGFPKLDNTAVFTPFDIISDFLRGIRGSSLDMYRLPQKVKAVQKKLLPMVINSAVENAKSTGRDFVFIPLHRGSDEFMSIEQFETFYWPDLRDLIVNLVKAKLTPMIFFEGSYDRRLSYLKELPAGKILGWFDRTDIVRAREALRDVMCIAGGMPVSLLQMGTADQVRMFARNLIDKVGKDGGFIMTSNGIIENAGPDMVKIWVNETRQYGHSCVTKRSFC